ncbi:MAG: hypothetical protein K0S65_2187, partial [Labilithrix sp.]|nr:hypothetical protein [Labilithrix sp.]
APSRKDGAYAGDTGIRRDVREEHAIERVEQVVEADRIIVGPERRIEASLELCRIDDDARREVEDDERVAERLHDATMHERWDALVFAV